MNKYFKRTKLQARRIRWSTTDNALKTFLYTLIVVVFFTAIIVLFSWGFTSLISAIQ